MRLVDYVVVLVLIAAGVVVAVSISRPARDSTLPDSQGETQALARRLDELAARVAAVEGAPIREGAPAPEAWTEADVAALRAGLEKVKVAEQKDRGVQRLRNVVAHIVPDAEPALREEALALLLETIEAARADGAQPAALRAELRAKLEEHFPEAIAERLAGLVPVEEPAEGPR